MKYATHDGQSWVELLLDQRLQEFFNSPQALDACSAYIFALVKGESDPDFTMDERKDLCAEIWQHFIRSLNSHARIEAPKGLLRMIAKRTCWKWNLRFRILCDREVSLSQNHELKRRKPDPLAELVREHGGLRAFAVGKLGMLERHVAILELRHEEQLSNQEVARKLGLSETAASNCYRRAHITFSNALRELAISDEELRSSQILRTALEATPNHSP